MPRAICCGFLMVTLWGLAGCGDEAGGPPGTDRATGCEGEALAPGDHEFTFEYDGETREYHIHVPPGYDASLPTPLVANYHGLTSDKDQQALFSEMNALADAEGFLVVYPNGLDNSWNGGACCPPSSTNMVDDVGFSRELVQQVGSQACVDSERVYATGMSNGGFMSHRLACEASDVFAAFGPVAGVLGLPPEDCTPERPVPIIHFHGTEDPLVAYESGDGFAGVVDTMQGWADRNGCDATPEETFRNGDAHCDSWSGCDADVEVTLCTIDGMGHCWPGSETGESICPSFGFGPGSLDIDANAHMWDLFVDSPLP
ncbi:MAG: alpha/beta hydrolase family esterase [Myxococcota bacterium]